MLRICGNALNNIQMNFEKMEFTSINYTQVTAFKRLLYCIHKFPAFAHRDLLCSRLLLQPTWMSRMT